MSGTEHGMELTADFFNDSVAIQFETESYSSGVNVNQYINPYDGMSQDYLADTNALRVNTQNISINRGTGGFDGTFVSLGDCPGCVEPLPPGFTYNGTINGAFTGSGEAAPKGAVGLINIENGDINAVGSFGTLKQ